MPRNLSLSPMNQKYTGLVFKVWNEAHLPNSRKKNQFVSPIISIETDSKLTQVHNRVAHFSQIKKS